MDVLAAKFVVLAALGALRLASGLLPLGIARRASSLACAISLALCFGGGVLLATCFLHILPEVREALDHSDAHVEYPLAELLFCCGFFLVYAVEELVHRFFHKPPPESLPPCCPSSVEAELKKAEPVIRPKSSGGRIAPAASQVHLLSSSLSLDTNAKAMHLLQDIRPRSPPEVKPPPSDMHKTESAYILGALKQKACIGNFRSFLVVLALSFHSVFEGLAIGLQQTQSDLWYLFAAVAIHACTILFCIGLELATSGLRTLQVVVYVVVLALVSPVGVALGMVVTVHAGDSQGLLVGVLQGLAGGTILYVTFFEVLSREKQRTEGSGLSRIVCIFLGFALMAALQTIGGHDHGHGPSLSNATGSDLHPHLH